MFRRNKRDPWTMSLDVAKEIGRRGFSAEARPVTVRSAIEDVQKFAIVIPGRGVALINNECNIVVASSNKPLPQAPVFEYKNVEAAAENILRSLPLP
jgi:hypothetical protein|nr:MAG TPA: hypothetical protein [Caudoviricetes sp.]